jgi:15-cis-phytoene synthase
MVNETAASPDDPERALALGYAPAESRAGLATLFALDDRLSRIVRETSEPGIGQLRLTWWFEALERLDREPAPAEPLLQALKAQVLSAGVTGGLLAGMVDGWEPLILEEAPDWELIGRERGGRLFEAAARLLGAADPRIGRMGEGWALAEFAIRWRFPDGSGTRDLAKARLVDLSGPTLPRALRPLGALALLARSDLAGGRPGSPGRVARLLAHRLTGR